MSAATGPDAAGKAVVGDVEDAQVGDDAVNALLAGQ